MQRDIDFFRYVARRECAANRDRYITLMQQASGELPRRFFAVMAGRKDREIRRLYRTGNRLALTRSANTPMSVCTVAPDHRLDALASLPDALLLARKLEFDGYRLFMKLASETHDEARQGLFLSMVHMYKSDVRLLEKLLSTTRAFSVRHL